MSGKILNDTMPMYKRHRQQVRTSAIKVFLDNLVIPDDFDMEDLEVVERHLEQAPIKVEAFCEWFGLGDWFYDEMVQDEFDIEQFMLDLRDRVENDSREATETYHEKRRDYMELIGMKA